MSSGRFWGRRPSRQAVSLREIRRPSAPQTIFRGREIPRVMSLIFMLAVLWMLITRASDPDTWRWLANDPDGGKPKAQDPDESPVAANVPVVEPKKTATPPQLSIPTEEVVANPTDQDPDEQDAVKEEFQAIADKQPLAAEEMPSYWRFMKWTRAQTFDELKARARRDVLFTQLWEQPDKYRGQLVYLKMHLKRALRHDEAPANPLGLKDVFEAWGWTEDSKSYPYLVVFPERPPGLPLGPDIHEEATFVGYFLKEMSYEAFDVRRAAPLLIGRLRWRENPTRVALRQQRDPEGFWMVIGIGGVALMGLIGYWVYRFRYPRKRQLATDLENQKRADAWVERLAQGPADDDEAEEDGKYGWADSRPDEASALDWTNPKTRDHADD